MQKITVNSPGEMDRVADAVLKIMKKDTGSTVALMGELGAGKTTFVKKLAERIGITSPITSPTFLIVKIYEIPNGRAEKTELGNLQHLYHIDAYRVESAKDLKSLKLNEVFNDKNNLVVVEWADKIVELIPENAIRVRFKHGDKKNERIVAIE